jgi:uncharacterized protein YdaU (DUF1376 family)
MPARPWFPWNGGDYRRDTQDFTEDEDLLYRRLLESYWELGGLPDDERALARISRIHLRKFRRSFVKVSSKFSRYSGRLIQKRMEAELNKAADIQQKRAKAGRASARTYAATHEHTRARVPQPHSTSGTNTDPKIGGQPIAVEREREQPNTAENFRNRWEDPNLATEPSDKSAQARVKRALAARNRKEKAEKSR